MNDEEEGAMEVMQEFHPQLIDEQAPSETKPGTEQVERGEQFEALEAANAALLESQKVDEREEGREEADSSSLGKKSGEVIVGGEVSLVTASEKEDGLMRGVEDSVAAEIEGDGQDDGVKRGESSMAGEEGEKLDGGGEDQTDMKQDDESNVVEETAKVGGTEAVDCSELKEVTEEMKERQSEAELEKEIETEKVDGGEEGREVGDSSSPVDRSGEFIVGAEGSAVKDEPNLENEGEREEEVLPVTVAVKEDGSIAGIEGMIVVQKDVGGEEENLDGDRETQKGKKPDDESNDVVETAEVDEKLGGDREIEEVDSSQLNAAGLFPVTLQDDVMVEGGNTKALSTEIKVVKESEFELKVQEEKGIKMEERQEAEEEVNEASPFGETATGENQVDVGSELGEEEEDPKRKESCPFGEEEKSDGDREAQTDDESNVGGDTAKVGEKMRGDREMEEVGGSQLNADGLFPVTLQDDEMVEDALGTEINVGKESEIGSKEETGEMEEEVERQGEANEDKEMDGGVEKEAKEEEREMAVEEEKQMEEDEREEAPKSGSGKRKRGRNSKSAGRAPPRKTVGEDVCFICLDGGDLVLCDRRACSKAYHPSCVDRDEAFFRSKGRWDCGWHLCRQCKKNAYYMCYMCQFSLCKRCLTDDVSFFCLRGSKGLCHTCIKSVMLIENNEGNDGMAAFDDKSSMDYLFKDYWTEQKENLSLTSDEIAMVTNRWKRLNSDPNQESPAEAHPGNTEGGVVSDSSLGTAEPTNSERKKSKKRMRSSTTEVDYHADAPAGKAEATGAKKKGRRRLKSQSEGADPNLDNSSKDDLGNVSRRKKAKKLSEAHAFEVDSASHMASINGCTSSQSSTEWASKELLEFVAHVKNGDKSALSQFDVQELLLEYVKRNKLRDPRRTSQIVCDVMLQKLFGKPRVGHIEMLKLLESHFLLKEDSQGDDNQGSVLDAEVSQLGTDENTDSFMDVGKSRGRKARKRGDSRGLQSNLDDYAAIDMHNIKLIYLRRNLIEALMEDRERFHEKVVGSFVRIRLTGSSQKQEIHRLVQVIGTPKVAQPYKVGKKTADCMLEILNLNKTEVISMDTISNQDFDEDECKRLRQSIKCGFLSRLTVGDVLDKAKDLHVVRVTDLLETEITRHNHLRDRASDLGRKKQLRECVEKLQILNTPEERQRRLDEIPEVHADPNMDPSHESEDESEPEKGRDIRPRETWRERDHFPSRREGNSPSTDPWSSEKSPNKKWELSRSLSGKGFSSRPGDAVVAEEALSGKPWSPVGDKLSSPSTHLEKLRTPSDSLTGNQGLLSETRTNSSARAPPETSQPPSTSLVQNEVKISETEKLWQYKDPTGKVQGPFSVVQLRKWNKSGYFPSTLRIWKTAQTENNSILLSEALAGRFEKEPTQAAVAKPIETPSQQVHRGQVINKLKIDQNRTTDQLLSPITQRSQADPRFSSNDSQNRPTSSQSISPSSTGRTRVSRWSGSPTPVQPPSTTTAATPDSSQVSRPSSPSYEQNRAFDRSHSAQQSTREVYAQKPPSQSTHQTLQQVVTDTATFSTNNSGHGSSNSVVAQPASGQNPAHGWGSGGLVLQPEMMNPDLINSNAMHTQGQQQQLPVYSNWAPANNLPPPPPPYSGGQTTSSATFPNQTLSALPSQALWTPQVPAAQPNVQPVGTAAPGNQGMTTPQLLPSNNAGWAQMQAYFNMGWGAPSGPSPVCQYGSQQGTTAGAAMVQASGPVFGMQPGNMNPGGWVASAVNPGVAGPWNWQQPPQAQGMVVAAPGTQIMPRGQKPCPYLMQGHCKKGAACDFRHN